MKILNLEDCRLCRLYGPTQKELKFGLLCFLTRCDAFFPLTKIFLLTCFANGELQYFEKSPQFNLANITYRISTSNSFCRKVEERKIGNTRQCQDLSSQTPTSRCPTSPSWPPDQPRHPYPPLKTCHNAKKATEVVFFN